jgi:hypothetical protein
VTSKILDSCYALRERIDYLTELKMVDVLPTVQNAYFWILYDRLIRCYDARIDDDRLTKLLQDLREDKQVVMQWNTAEEYKHAYEVLCDSYEDFVKYYKGEYK